MIKVLVIVLVLSSYLFGNILEVYFDTPKLYLLDNNLTLKYKVEEYTSKKNKLKYKENIIFIDKNQKLYNFKVKHYKTVKSIEEKHPLLSLVKRRDRKTFISLLKNNGIVYPMKLKYVLKVSNIASSLDENVNYKKNFEAKKQQDSFFDLKFKYPYYNSLIYLLIFLIFWFIMVYNNEK